MWPWGHLAIGYLCYSAYTRGVLRQRPAHRPTIALAVATQFPDLVDKPLAYWLAVIPEGRSLAHSLLVAIPLCVLVWRVGARRNVPRDGGAFVFGYLSHLLVDGYGALLAGRFGDASFLLWPVLAPPDYATHTFAQHWTQLLGSLREITLHGVITGNLPSVAYQGLLAGLVAVLWIVDGGPGVRPALDWLRARRSDVFR